MTQSMFHHAFGNPNFLMSCDTPLFYSILSKCIMLFCCVTGKIDNSKNKMKTKKETYINETVNNYSMPLLLY